MSDLSDIYKKIESEPEKNPEAESLAELERLKMAKVRKRAIILVISLALTISMRLIFKNPPKLKQADYSKVQFKALPGVLNNLSVAEQMKLSPQMVTALREADLRNQKGNKPSLAEGIYIPADTPYEDPKEKAAYEKLLADFEIKRKQMTDKHKLLARDLTKDTLIVFQKGGFIKAENAGYLNNQVVDIFYNKTLTAKLPKSLISEVRENAVDWEEPVPSGFRKIQPAKGITIIVSMDISERITVLKLKKDDEI